MTLQLPWALPAHSVCSLVHSSTLLLMSLLTGARTRVPVENRGEAVELCGGIWKALQTRRENKREKTRWDEGGGDGKEKKINKKWQTGREWLECSTNYSSYYCVLINCIFSFKRRRRTSSELNTWWWSLGPNVYVVLIWVCMGVTYRLLKVVNLV